MPSTKKKLLVVGAGASGLPSIRHALLYDNAEVTCFEGTDDVGGLWKYNPNETDLSCVMKSTVINTSKEMTAYSDFPPEDTMANFMHNTEMHRYLKSYAEHFNLLKHIKFNHKVLSIDRAVNYNQTGMWCVKYTDQNWSTHEETFDGVLLCSGHHAAPYVPEKWPGQDTFKGRIIHSHSYKDHKGYEDKVIVVVGIGNSGGDCAVELSRIGKQVYLSTRRGSWIFNRIFEHGEPVDLVFNTKMRLDLTRILPRPLINFEVERKLNMRFDHEKYGLKPKHRVTSAHPTLNDELPNRIACGTVRMKPGISRFTETAIEFTDGTRVENVDEVILATGFSFEFRLIENGKLVPVQNNELDAYKYMFPLQTADHNSLGIIGLLQPVGSVMPLSEMQARVFLENFAGKSKLPSEAEMKADVEKKRNEMKKRYVESRRHTLQVDYQSYIHELADLIGCNVELMKLWTTDPKLACQVYFGPCVPYLFRLQGPNSWEGAREAIMTVDYRVRKAMRNDVIPRESDLLWNMLKPISIFFALIALFIVIF